jgi:hypothetical protein
MIEVGLFDDRISPDDLHQIMLANDLTTSFDQCDQGFDRFRR